MRFAILAIDAQTVPILVPSYEGIGLDKFRSVGLQLGDASVQLFDVTSEAECIIARGFWHKSISFFGYDTYSP
jgi:hypothetical protein